MPLLSRVRALRQGGPPVVEANFPLWSLDRLSPASQPEAGGPHAPHSSGMSLPQRYAQIVQDLRTSMLSTCHWLCPEDVKIVGEHPIGAGGFTNIWEATRDGRKVVLKSYRFCLLSDVSQIVARFLNEVHVYNLLRDGDIRLPLLVGVYSTETHPFGLVYEYVDGLDVKQYLRNEPNVRRLKLLAGIAQCLNLMHDLDIVHGDLRTPNILVHTDGTPRITGLGNAYILSHSTAWKVEDRMRIDRLSRSRAPELAGPRMSPNANGPTHPTKASDMYAFGVMAWEILTGQPPFFEMTEIAATYSMLNGNRPLRPNHHDISNQLWYIIERCWHNVPSERISAGEVVNLLETELQHIPGPRALPRV